MQFLAGEILCGTEPMKEICIFIRWKAPSSTPQLYRHRDCNCSKGLKQGCYTRLKKSFQGKTKLFPQSTNHNYPRSIEKSNLSYQVWPHKRFTFFPVLQKLTHMLITVTHCWCKNKQLTIYSKDTNLFYGPWIHPLIVSHPVEKLQLWSWINLVCTWNICSWNFQRKSRS